MTAIRQEVARDLGRGRWIGRGMFGFPSWSGWIVALFEWVVFRGEARGL
jgi:hypothetical protein